MDTYISNGGTEMKNFLFILILLTISSSAYAQDNKPQSFLKCNYIVYLVDSPPLSLAIRQTSGNVKFLIMQNDGYYILPKQNEYRFIVNTRSSMTSESYLGVFIDYIYSDQNNMRDPLFLTRNDAKWKSGEGRQLEKRLTGPPKSNKKIDAYILAHQDTKTIQDADSILGFTWHATTSDNIYNSFDYREKWLDAFTGLTENSRFKNFLRSLSIENAYYHAITVHLLHYTASARPRRLADFSMTPGDAKGAVILIFTPINPEATKQFYVQFGGSKT